MSTHSPIARGTAIGAALLILLVAAALRIIGLEAYPPGPHYDEAVYLQIARSIAFGGARFFPIVEAYQGREVLWMYVNAPLLALIHDGIFTLQLSSVWANLLTVAGAIGIARLMFPGRRGVLVGLGAGAVLAIAFPQVWLARQAFRAVSLPLMETLALLALWRGLALGRRTVPGRPPRAMWAWLAAGGFLAGAALYTYMASRLFPFWLALGLLPLVFDRARWRLRAAQLAVWAAALAATAAPMVVYALQRPEIFFGRLTEVTQAGQSVSLGESIGLHAAMFAFAGDPYFRYNIAGRPYFTPPEAVLLVIGLAGLAVLFVSRRAKPETRAAALMVVFSPLMVIPSVISVGGLPPSHMRSLSMVPLIFIAVGFGFAAVVGGLERARSVRARGAARWALPALLVFTGAGAAHTAAAYHGWATSAAVFYETDADLAAAADWLSDPAHTDGLSVYVAARDRRHPTVEIAPVPPVTWLGTNTLFRPPAGTAAVVVFPRSAPPPPDWAAWLEPGRITDGLPIAPDGRTAFEAFTLTSDAPLPPMRYTPPVFLGNGVLTLLGSTGEPVQAGSEGELITLWEVAQPAPSGDYTPIVQLEDEAGAVLARADVYMTDADRWPAGAVLMQRVRFSTPALLAPGTYRVRGAWVERAADRYSTWRVGGNTAPGGIWTDWGTVTVTPARDAAAAPRFPAPAEPIVRAGPLRLLGWDTVSAQARPGETVSAVVYWAADEDGLLPRVETALRDSTGAIGANTRAPAALPLQAAPVSAGTVLAAPLRWSIPRTWPGGPAELLLVGETGATVSLGRIQADGRPRVLEPISVAVVFAAGDRAVIGLRDVSATARDGSLFVDVRWQALSDPPADYTVFVHVIDAQGAIVAQIDAMPQANTYPTGLWAARERVDDVFTLVIPADRCGQASRCRVRIGLYDARTGERLRTARDTDSAAGLRLSESTIEADSVLVPIRMR
jgi:hypothetical protein